MSRVNDCILAIFGRFRADRQKRGRQHGLHDMHIMKEDSMFARKPRTRPRGSYPIMRQHAGATGPTERLGLARTCHACGASLADQTDPAMRFCMHCGAEREIEKGDGTP
jgi:hypothetical protein